MARLEIRTLARDRAILGFMAGIILLILAGDDARTIQISDPFSLGSTLGLAVSGIAVMAITFYSLTQGDYDLPDNPKDIAAHEVTVAVYDLMGTPLESEKDMSPELLQVISKVLGERKPNTRAALEREHISARILSLKSIRSQHPKLQNPANTLTTRPNNPGDNKD